MSDDILFGALQEMLNQLEDHLGGLLFETPLETEIVHGIFVKTLISLLDRDPAELTEFRGKRQSFLNALVRRFPSDLAELSEDEFKDYYREVRERYPTEGGLVDLMRSIVVSLEPQVRATSEAFPEVARGLVGALHFCYAYNIDNVPRAGLDDIQALDTPGIVAFSFGAGKKIGPAMEYEALTGPGCEQPGAMNMVLAGTIANLLQHRKMPVFAQWEIADALIYGEEGCPAEKAQGYFESDIEKYPFQEQWRDCDVHKAVPLWPEICREQNLSVEQMGQPSRIKKYYLSVHGNVEFFRSRWRKWPAAKPKSVIIVAAPDHMARCVAIFRAQTDIETVLCCPREFVPKWEDYGCLPNSGYDPRSTQEWTTSRAAFIEKETTMRFAIGMSLLEQSKWYDSRLLKFTEPEKCGGFGANAGST